MKRNGKNNRSGTQESNVVTRKHEKNAFSDQFLRPDSTMEHRPVAALLRYGFHP